MTGYMIECSSSKKPYFNGSTCYSVKPEARFNMFAFFYRENSS